MPSRIEDYAFIVDCETAALVSKNGSIDWLCWPWFDLAACFAALLDNANNGRWQVAFQRMAARRSYWSRALLFPQDIEPIKCW